MTVGNIATDGYGLNATEKPNVPINGYGAGLPTGLFDGSVTGVPLTREVVEGFFDELLVIDAELEQVATLIDSVTVTELVGTPLATAQMVGVGIDTQVVGSVVTVEALDSATVTDVPLQGATSHIGSLIGSTGGVSAVLDPAPTDSPGMIGDDETETGVV